MPDAPPPESSDPRNNRRPVSGRKILLEFVVLASIIGLSIWYVRRQRNAPPPDPVEHADLSKAAVDEATAKLREAQWLNFENVTREELDRRLILLDQAIAAAEQHSLAVQHMDRTRPDYPAYQRRRAAYEERAESYRLGRSTLRFLREHYGHWQYDAKEQNLKFDEDALVERFARLQSELQEDVRRQKQPATQATKAEGE